MLIESGAKMTTLRYRRAFSVFFFYRYIWILFFNFFISSYSLTMDSRRLWMRLLFCDRHWNLEHYLLWRGSYTGHLCQHSNLICSPPRRIFLFKDNKHCWAVTAISLPPRGPSRPQVNSTLHLRKQPRHDDRLYL